MTYVCVSLCMYRVTYRWRKFLFVHDRRWNLLTHKHITLTQHELTNFKAPDRRQLSKIAIDFKCQKINKKNRKRVMRFLSSSSSSHVMNTKFRVERNKEKNWRSNSNSIYMQNIYFVCAYPCRFIFNSITLYQCTFHWHKIMHKFAFFFFVFSVYKIRHKSECQMTLWQHRLVSNVWLNRSVCVSVHVVRRREQSLERI